MDEDEYIAITRAEASVLKMVEAVRGNPAPHAIEVLEMGLETLEKIKKRLEERRN